MKVSRERLQIIGKMISVLREEKRQNKQNNWTQIKFCENICSPNTLKSIESGKVGRLDAIYEQLLEKLGLKYGEFPVIDEAIEQVVDNLRTAIEFFDVESIKKYSLMGMKILENAKGYIYYSDLYEIMSDVYNYYEEDVLIKEQKAEHYLHVLDIFYTNLKDIVKILIFAGIKATCVSNINTYTRIVEFLEMEKSSLSCLKVNLMHYYYKIDERVKELELIKSLESKFKESNNLIRLLDTYNGAINLMGYIDKKLVDEYISKTMSILEFEKIPVSKKSETYTNIADSYHRRKDYTNALKYFNEAVSEGCEVLIFNYILIADCQNHLNLPIDIPELERKYVKKFPHELRIMYNYFLTYNGEEMPPLLKQKLLMKKVAPILHDEVVIDIFAFELKKLIKSTNSYKDLYTFDEITSNE